MASLIFNALFPARCVFCTLPPGNKRICRRCIDILPWNDRCCERCGQPVSLEQPAGVPCADCQRRPPVFCKARAPLRYALPVDVALKKMKFRRQLTFAPVFAELMLPLIASDFADYDVLVPVPLYRWRHFTRGFNQADELGRHLEKSSGLPVIKSVVRTRATRPQSGLSAAERRKNIGKAFAMKSLLLYRKPLIIDDVITTGTTCNELAKTLIDAGAEKVGVLTVAHSGQAG